MKSILKLPKAIPVLKRAAIALSLMNLGAAHLLSQERQSDSATTELASGPPLHGVANWHSTYWADDPNGKFPPSGRPAELLVDGQPNGSGDMTITNSAFRPTWHSTVAAFNNRAAWLFDGHADRAKPPDPSRTLGADIEFVLIYKIETLGAHNPLLCVGGGATMDVLAHAATADSYFELRSGQTPAFGGIPDKDTRVLFASFKGDGKDRLIIDDTVVIEADTGQDELDVNVRLASKSDDSFTRMYVAFLGIKQGGLTTDERAAFLEWATSYYKLSRNTVGIRAPSWPKLTVPTLKESLAQGEVVLVDDVGGRKDRSTFPGRVIDARGAIVRGTDDYPINFGHGGPLAYTTWVGGVVDNTLPREYDWRTLKGPYDGVGMRSTNKGWLLVHGFAARNVMDMFRPKPGHQKTVAEQFHYRHCLGIYIRDDFVENDNCMPGTLFDCCANGTYTWHSQQHSNSVGGTIAVTDCLVRMEEQPNILHAFEKLPRNKSWVSPGTPPTSVDGSKFDPQVIKQLVQASIDKGFPNAAYAYGWGQIWKLQTQQATPIHVTNTLFWAPSHSLWSRSGLGLEHHVDGAADITYENSVLIWTGTGPYPCAIPTGLTLVDRFTPKQAQEVWDAAYTNWLQRHGRSTTDPFTIVDDEKFLNPDAAPDVMKLLPAR